MATFTDVLDGTDGVSIATSAQLTWRLQNGDITYWANRARGPAAAYGTAVAEHDVGSSNMAVEGTVFAFSGQRCGVAARQDATNWNYNYRFYFQVAGGVPQWRVWAESLAGSNLLASPTVVGDAGAGRRLRLEVEDILDAGGAWTGTAVRGLVDGTEVVNVTDTINRGLTSQRGSLYLYEQTDIDNFLVESLTAPAPAPASGLATTLFRNGVAVDAVWERL